MIENICSYIMPLTFQTFVPITYAELSMTFNLFLFVLELNSTVTKLAKIQCQCKPVNCRKLLPLLPDLEILMDKVDQLLKDTWVAYEDGSPLLPTKFDLRFLDAWTNKMVENVVAFCIVHTGTKHKIKDIKDVLRYVSFVFFQCLCCLTRLLRNNFLGLECPC